MNMESIEQALRDAFVNAGFEHAVDGFIQNLKDEVEREQGRGRLDTKIGYNIYCRWSFRLINAGVGNNSIYNFPKEALDFIRSIAPGNVKGETGIGNYNVTMVEFCRAMING